MNFFQHQDAARKKTGFLVVGFALVIILILAVIDIFIYVYGREYGDVTMLISGANIFVLAVILIGSIVKYWKLRGGGKSVADMINAEAISRDSEEPKLRQLVNIVDEISIASGIASPALYYMPEEKGINAFVAGFDSNDIVLVVTQGALDKLNRDELQGVIAHEFSHIFNADTKINLRLMAVLGGLLVMSQVGYNILCSQRTSSRRSSNNNSIAVPFVGSILFLLGYIGLFFGNIIKSAISRQREYLSDASAVQFTRNPRGIGKALMKIAAQGKSAYLGNKNSEDISHMCFAETIKAGFLNPFSTHPKIDLRIKAIDTTGEIWNEYQQELLNPLSATSSSQKVSDSKKEEHNSILQDPHKLHILAGLLMKSVGNPTQASYTNAQQIINSLPEELKKMTYNTDTAQQLAKQILINPMENYLVLLDMSLPALKELDNSAAELFIKDMFSLAKKNKNISLHEALILTILREHLGARSGGVTRILYNRRSVVEKHIHCVQAYLHDHLCQDYTILQLTRALKKLRHMAPQLKQEFIQECISIVQRDGKVSQHEYAMLRTIGSCLDCPISL